MLIFRVFTDAGCSGDIPFPGGIAALNPRLLPQSSLGELKVHIAALSRASHDCRWWAIPFPGGIAALNPRLLPQSSLGELKVHTLRFLVLRTILRLK